MSDIRWEDPPPPPPPPPTPWATRLAPLMEHPKRWAVVAVKVHYATARMAAYNLRRGLVTLPAGRWEFAAGTVDGENRVYARYLGPDDTGGES